MFKEQRIFLAKKFKEDVRNKLKLKGISQNSFARTLGISQTTLSDCLSQKFTIPISLFEKIVAELGLNEIDKYVMKTMGYNEMRKEIAKPYKNFTHLRQVGFKTGDNRTKELAVKGGKKGGKIGGQKVSKMLMLQKKGIFDPKHVAKRSFYGKKAGQYAIQNKLGPFSPTYYSLDEEGCQSKPERKVFNYMKTFCKVVSINKNSEYWFKCGEHIFRFDFYLPEFDVYIEVCGCLGDPRYNDKADRIKSILENYPEIKIIFIVNNMEFAKELFKDILNRKQVLGLYDLKNLEALNSKLSVKP